MRQSTAEDAVNGTVEHWQDCLNKTTKKIVDFKLVIPSFDRPTELCGNTLALLH